MKYETLQNLHIPKIGFGTWKIGGEAAANPALEEKSLAALRSALDLGYTHFDTAEYYAAGHCEELLGRAIREANTDRTGLFITSKVSPEHLRSADVLRACEGSLKRLGMDTLDLYLIHWPNRSIPLEDTFRALNLLVAQGKVKYLGVSNFDLALLKQAVALAETPIVTDQIQYSLSERTYIKDGVLTYCQANNILLTAYSPVKGGRMKANPALQQVAASHKASSYQVALAWLVMQPKVITIPMSFNPEHQAENFNAADLTLSEAEMLQLDGLR
jgi:diketogulonate reductase-like aldo/keto reductase